jgi:hypothetical protein
MSTYSQFAANAATTPDHIQNLSRRLEWTLTVHPPERFATQRPTAVGTPTSIVIASIGFKRKAATNSPRSR